MTAQPIEIEEYDKRTQFYTEEVPPLLAELLQANAWKSCLDVGCGDGSLLHALNKQGHLKDKSVYALDMSKHRLSLVSEVNKEIACLVGNASDSPVKAGSIDFLISTQVIEHVDDDGNMVKDLHRVLADNGTLYLATVFKKWYGWYFHRCNGRWTLDPTHLREYTQDNQLLDKIRSQGFEVSHSIKTQDTRPLLDAVLRRIHAPRDVYNSRILRLLRRYRLPIFGYYIWEIVCQKQSA